MKEHLQKFLCYNLSRSDTNGNDKEQSRRRNQYHHRAIPQKKKICKQFFLTFPIMSLINVYLKTTRKDSSPCLPKEKRWADLTPFMSLLVLIRCVISTAHGTFCSGWKRGLFN